MRYTASYQNGIESVDRRYRIVIAIIGDGELSDEGDILFLKKGASDSDLEMICRCGAAVSRSVYDLVAFSIQDGQSITQGQLYSAIKMLAKKCSGLWSEGKVDGQIEEIILGGG